GTFDGGGGGEDSGCRAAEMAEAEPTELERDRTSKETEGREVTKTTYYLRRWWWPGTAPEVFLPPPGGGSVFPCERRRETAMASTEHGVIFFVVADAVWDSHRRWGWPVVRGAS
ncbi:hypothetical protein PIB30_102225, partial [Stylosanthes scabra]|nr:hypothetical protein [Stylosanthes scabra]